MKRLLTLSLLCPVLMSAQGYQLHVQGQRQQAMGNVGTGFVQDAATIFYNPGGVSFVGNSVSLGASGLIANSAFQDSITGQISNAKLPLATPITLYAAYGVTDSTKSKILQNLKFGIGVYTPFGGSANWPSDWIGKYIVKTVDLKFISIQPTVSYKINNKIGIGAGFVYTMGSFDFTKDVFLAGSSGNEGTAEIKSKLSGYGVNAGVYFKPTEEFSIGLSYRSGIKTKSKGGTAEFTTPASLKDSVPNTDAKLTFPLPTVISLGLGYKLTDKFAIALDMNYIGFKVYDTLRVDFDKNTSSNPDVAEPRNWKNTYSFHLGGQYLATEALAIRLGTRYVITPVPDGMTTPDGGDASRIVLCGGLGYKINSHFSLDASYSFENIVRKDNNKHYNFIGVYKTYLNTAGLSVTYNF